MPIGLPTVAARPRSRARKRGLNTQTSPPPLTAGGAIEDQTGTPIEDQSGTNIEDQAGS